ncbi:hypothetical protein J14TS2_00950 [Bacillus sp. J14TS2]|uniref:CDP-glycerol glycerophosphotransferase family protein n=1 Tax=Bacillus sp. J14TS2 TaxID=2807188 RepID=UPI001B185A7F|nr:CDP-glycerol glycerophosphotransferase family protein [Bacillus sp. J14TS2]GIN69620.1 hypothetical protein J14TS2_00950 [Bacillus sp. J14TS2]
MSIKQKFFSKNAFQGIFYLLTYAIPMFILSQLLQFNSKYKDIWIVCERFNEARDNGYHLFKYIREKHSKIKCFYIIDRSSADLSKVGSFENVIYFGTFKHYLYYFLAKRHISTHGAGNGCMPNIYACKLLDFIVKPRAKNVYLKHGIIKDDLPSLHKNKSRIDLFVCGASLEYKLVKEKFGFNNNEVKYLGLARFDNLMNFSAKKQIMYMPTWRTFLRYSNSKEFKESNYYKKINALLNNKELIDFLDHNDVSFVLCLHPLLKEYSHLFNKTGKNIKINNTAENDIQLLLKESALLITDHSSIYFDFAYMNKPIVYYQFDNEEFFKSHSGIRKFDYLKQGFGPVLKNEEELVKQVINISNNNFKNTRLYEKRIEDCFPLRDNKNCERNFLSILNL